MDKTPNKHHKLAEAITKAASKQTYYTIRLFVDRDLVSLAYQAYAYFRWVDDTLDREILTKDEKVAFANRQVDLLTDLYLGHTPVDLCPEELMLVDLVQRDSTKNSGLASYLHNMMAVMVIDAERNGRVITQQELSTYIQSLAVSVTDALHYFIGHETTPALSPYRYHAVTAAHITHMLRDAHEDSQTGYYNIPREYLKTNTITAQDIRSTAYRQWVCQQVTSARRYFNDGRKYLAGVRNLRCRLVGYAYTARFEWVLNRIARENYCLRPDYSDRKSLRAGLWMGWKALTSFLVSPFHATKRLGLAIKPAYSKEI